MKSLLVFFAAALAEIGGCFATWAVVRNGASAWWLLPGLMSLALFAWLLTAADATFAGRAYAAYGGIYVVASLLWLHHVEGATPDLWDIAGGGLCLAGTCLILFAHRPA